MRDDAPYDTRASAKPRRHRRRRRSRGFTVVLVLVLLATVGVGGYFGYDKVKSFFVAPDYAGDGNGVKVQVEIAEGSNLTQMGDALVKEDVVKSAKAFANAAEANPKANSIGAGTYSLEKQMSGASAVERMLDPKSRKVAGVTIREGLTQWTTYEKLSEATGVSVDEFKAAAKDPEALGIDSTWFERKDGKDVVPTVEGFLFPANYEFKKNASAADMLKQMVAKFNAVTESMDFIGSVESNVPEYSPYEVLINASMAQAEAGIAKDLGKIARVAYNRLETPDVDAYFCDGEPGHCLEYDTTTNYGLMAAGKGSKNSKHMTHDDLYDESNKWSTHAFSGLPPTPIDSPGKEALEGAANPPDGKWIFFVAIDKDGSSAFAETADEHKKNVDEAKRKGIL